jgi:1-acyl-sn-glycerol-3-phosphate acyltransferase
MKEPVANHHMLVVMHTVIIYLWVIFATVVFGTAAIVASLFSRSGDMVHRIGQIWGKTILMVSGIRASVNGLEHIRPDRSYIFMSNHQSNFDIPVLYSKLDVQFRWLAKAELFKIPIFGRGMRGAGYISIDRSDRRSAFKSLARAAESIRAGTSVLVFPEGTRSSDGHLLPFKKGGFVLAVDAAVPVVPIVINGTHAIMQKGNGLIRSRSVKVQISEPIDAAQFTRKNKNGLMERVRDAMCAALPSQPGSPDV